MGVCCSCLGFNRSRDQSDDSETRGLLYDDPYRSGRYGAMGGAGGAHSFQRGVGEGEDSRRKREQVQAIVGAMSDNIVDFFTGQPLQQQTTQNQMQVQQQTQVSGFDGLDNSHPRIQSPQVNGEHPSADLSLKTIKKGRAGPVFTSDDQGVFGLKAVHDAIG